MPPEKVPASGKRVLIVDDEPDFLCVLKKRLEASHYRVRTARDGREALEEIHREKPDVVLLDIQMPEMDGLRVLQRIRRWDKRLPIFILTAYSSEERFRSARRWKASGFIVKTGDLTQQLKRIASVLELSDKYRAKRA